ncbi:MAG: Replication factor C small subunit, partial [Pyrobaculum sp.]
MAELFWFEKYRPSTFDEVVDLEEVKFRLREFV